MDWSLWSNKKTYSPNKEIRIKKLMLRSDLCDYSDAYNVVKGKIIVDKKHGMPIILMCPVIQQLMLLLLILKIIMHLKKKTWFLKVMYHLLTAFKNQSSTNWQPRRLRRCNANV